MDRSLRVANLNCAGLGLFGMGLIRQGMLRRFLCISMLFLDSSYVWLLIVPGMRLATRHGSDYKVSDLAPLQNEYHPNTLQTPS